MVLTVARRKHVPFEHKPLVEQVADDSRAGTIVRIKGERGKFNVRAEVLTWAGTEWVELWDTARKQFRSVRPDRVLWPREKRGSN